MQYTRAQMSCRGLVGLGLLMLFGHGCYRDADVYNERSAELECGFLNRCMADRFRQTCQPCTEHEQCPLGSCDKRRGLCRDGRGHFFSSEQDRLNQPCAGENECGSMVCRTHYPSIAACEDVMITRLAKNLEKCVYNAEAGRECVRLQQDRSCGDELPEICKFVYDTCES